ncbi:MAG: LysM peptidoglycan-binding domain-containing protein [Proteobacteria bacterium]|nr:LysM peptidoglycan-binding domain-containing protein [Pseudomonadota bacterium]
MKRLIPKLMIVSCATVQAFALDTYIVKYGDTLSNIVRQHYPQDRLYGANGKLDEVLKKNPHIKNSDRIYPNQKVYFAIKVNESISSLPDEKKSLSHSESEVSIESQNEPLAEPKRKISGALGLDEWNLSILYGAKYLSLSQSGNLGKANVGALFLNDIKLNSEFVFEDWSVGFQVDTYKFKYESLTKGDSKQMSSLNLYGSYRWIIAGLSFEETPLFRNNGGSIEMTKNTLMYLSVGAKKDIELPTKKPTVLKLKGWVGYPISSSGDKAEVKLSSVSGFALNGLAELNRQIFAKEDYSLHATWVTSVGYKDLNQNVEWDVSKGKSESRILDASTALGMLFKF